MAACEGQTALTESDLRLNVAVGSHEAAKMAVQSISQLTSRGPTGQLLTTGRPHLFCRGSAAAHMPCHVATVAAVATALCRFEAHPPATMRAPLPQTPWRPMYNALRWRWRRLEGAMSTERCGSCEAMWCDAGVRTGVSCGTDVLE
jgi:hypothetical protein